MAPFVDPSTSIFPTSSSLALMPQSCDTIAPQGTQTMPDLIGRTLGHYRIVDKIGAGRDGRGVPG